MFDTIRIYFEGLEPQEVRVKAGTPVGIAANTEWCHLILPGGDLVAFHANFERLERIHEALA